MTTALLTRHAELVSASILPLARTVRAEKWTLKQVQGDQLDRFKRGFAMKGTLKLLFLLSLAALFGVIEAELIYVLIYGLSVFWSFYSFTSKPGNLSRDVGKLRAALLSLFLAVSITGLGYAIGLFLVGKL